MKLKAALYNVINYKTDSWSDFKNQLIFQRDSHYNPPWLLWQPLPISPQFSEDQEERDQSLVEEMLFLTVGNNVLPWHLKVVILNLGGT